MQHDILLEPCGFTSIAIVSEAQGSDATATFSQSTASKARPQRWLIFVDRRRGLLGRVHLGRPSLADSPPGRRRSCQFHTRRTPPTDASLEPGPETTIPTESDDPSARQHPHCGEQSIAVTQAGIENHPCRVPVDNLSRTATAEQQGKASTRFATYDTVATTTAAEAGPTAQSLGNISNEENRREWTVEVLLRGLNKPFLVAAEATAAAAGGGIRGVFFIDKELPTTTTCTFSERSTTDEGGVTPQQRTFDETPRWQKTIQPRAYSSLNSSTAGQTWRLRFLRWESKQPITLVRKLRNPIALCVSSYDSSVFVLEEVWERRRQRDGDHDRDQHQYREGLGKSPSRRQQGYRVSRLNGPCLLAWLDKTAKNNSTIYVDKFAVFCEQQEQMRKRTGLRSALTSASVDGVHISDDGSETDWETVSGSSSGDDVGKCGSEVGLDSPIGSRVTADNPGSLPCSRQRRGVVNFVEVLKLPTCVRKHDDGKNLHPEQPVDLCLLADGTMVVAFSRSAPLHDGASIAKSQGVIRAFPASDHSKRSSERGDVGTSFPEASTAESNVAATIASRSHLGIDVVGYETYDVDDGWLVAEGLPVITGLAAGCEGAVYLSLCGAGHDGSVTAVGSLSVRQCRPSSQVDPGREDSGRRSGSREGDTVSSERERMSSKRVGGSGAANDGAGSFVRIASGFAAAVAVDDDMNLYYITAESKGSCRALWCDVAGVKNHRVAPFRDDSPTARFIATATPSQLVGPAHPAGQAGGGAKKKIGFGRSLERCIQPQEGEESSENEHRQTRGTRSQPEAGMAMTTTAAAAAAAAAKTTRAASLSAALDADDGEVALASGAGRKPLFASRHHSSDGQRQGDEDDEPVNIAVFARCRPLLMREMKRGARAAVFCDGSEIVVCESLTGKRQRRFEFDRVFGPGTSQARVYAEAVCPVVRKMLDGYNCSVLAYGQTGSGKTFTMEGGLVDPSSTGQEKAASAPDEDDTNAYEVEKVGIIPRAVHTIFREGGEGGSRRYWVYVSHMEIYNERLFDLLAPSAEGVAAASRLPSSALSHAPSRRTAPSSPTHWSPRIVTGSGSLSPPRTGQSPRAEGLKSPTGLLSPKNGPQKPSPRGAVGGGSGGGGGGSGAGLTIEEDRQLGVVVKGLTQLEVKSPEDIFSIIARSKRNRRTAETMCNVESSRSHGVFSVRVISAEPTPWGGEITRDGRLSLVDLSGSENIKRSGAVGDRAREAAAIGQSLLALGRVINALVQRSPHIPFRESKLTRVLGDSLGGNAFTAIILNITPNSGMLDETLNTLTYAKTAQSVQNIPKQHVASKVPTDEATTERGDGGGRAAGGGGGEGGKDEPEVPSEALNITCSVAKELRRWRGDAKSRLMSSGSSRRAHICPWVSEVPIRAPRPLAATGDTSSSKGSSFHHQQRDSSSASPRTLNGSRKDQIGGKLQAISGNMATSLSRPQTRHTQVIPPGDGDRRRPAIAGAMRTRATNIFRGESKENESSRDQARAAHGLSKGPTFTLGAGAGRGRGTGTAVAHARFPSSTWEKNLVSTEPDGRRQHRVKKCRVFDSTAAEWVHNTVLNHAAKRRPVTRTVACCTASGKKSSPILSPAAAKVGENDGAGLTAAAKSAIEEIFSRYNRSSIPGRDFLLSSEISALDGIWTRPDTEPPPPRMLLQQRSSSSFLLQRPRPISRLEFAAAPTRLVGPATGGGSGAAGGSLLEAPESRDFDGRDTRVLTQSAFIEFCRRAATRDAIFIRHLFVRCGYDSRLELRAQQSRGNDTAVRQRKGSTALERRHSKDGHVAKKFQLKGSHGSGSERTDSPTPHFAAIPQEQGLLDNDNDDIRRLTSGGIVDPAELWLWTDDGRDHGARVNMDGLLSRGGGAHVSRSAGATAATVVGAFAGPTRRPSSATTMKVRNKYFVDLSSMKSGAPDAEIKNDADLGCVSEPTAGVGIRNGVGFGATSISPGNTPSAALAVDVGIGGPTAVGDESPGMCEWCGVMLAAGGTHSAAFCEEGVVEG